MKTWEKVGKVKKDGKRKFLGIISWCIFSTSKNIFLKIILIFMVYKTKSLLYGSENL